MKRAGVLRGGHPHILDIAKTVPPSQRLRIARYEELASNDSYGGSTTACDSDEENEGLTKLRKLKSF